MEKKGHFEVKIQIFIIFSFEDANMEFNYDSIKEREENQRISGHKIEIKERNPKNKNDRCIIQQLINYRTL